MKLSSIHTKTYSSIFSLTIAWLWLSSLHAQESNTATMELKFENVFGNQPIHFQEQYTTASGETLKFTLLNYFISNIKLIRKNGEEFVLPQETGYHLVKQSIPESKSIKLQIPKGKYKGISFIVGVDSVRNTLRADKRGGDLDVGSAARDMYWAWNSGYIFFKMEGKSQASPDSLHNSFYYHIGGYGGFDSKTINNIKVKDLTFDKPVKMKNGKAVIVNIEVDTKTVFDGQNKLLISRHPSIMWGPVSVQIADNYARTFTLKSVMSL